MARIGYHASHEQFPPSKLLAWTRRAEAAGFQAFFSSDHFHPWSEAQGQSGFSWSWMGAALASTNLPGSMICCPGYRQHPAVVAQGAATLAEMFEGRFWLAVGSGQALNERITGEIWPTRDQRNARLAECVQIIRALWAGETVTHRGLVKVEEAKLYTLPHQRPLLVGAAVTEQTAEWVGGWADALITTSRPPDELKKMREAFWLGGGEGKPLFLKVGLAFGRTDDEARQSAHHQWRAVAFHSELLTELRTPRELIMLARMCDPRIWTQFFAFHPALRSTRSGSAQIWSWALKASHCITSPPIRKSSSTFSARRSCHSSGSGDLPTRLHRSSGREECELISSPQDEPDLSPREVVCYLLGELIRCGLGRTRLFRKISPHERRPEVIPVGAFVFAQTFRADKERTRG